MKKLLLEISEGGHFAYALLDLTDGTFTQYRDEVEVGARQIEAATGLTTLRIPLDEIGAVKFDSLQPDPEVTCVVTFKPHTGEFAARPELLLFIYEGELSHYSAVYVGQGVWPRGWHTLPSNQVFEFDSAEDLLYLDAAVEDTLPFVGSLIPGYEENL